MGWSGVATVRGYECRDEEFMARFITHLPEGLQWGFQAKPFSGVLLGYVSPSSASVAPSNIVPKPRVLVFTFS